MTISVIVVTIGLRISAWWVVDFLAYPSTFGAVLKRYNCDTLLHSCCRPISILSYVKYGNIHEEKLLQPITAVCAVHVTVTSLTHKEHLMYNAG